MVDLSTFCVLFSSFQTDVLSNETEYMLAVKEMEVTKEI